MEYVGLRNIFIQRHYFLERKVAERALRLKKFPKWKQAAVQQTEGNVLKTPPRGLQRKNPADTHRSDVENFMCIMYKERDSTAIMLRGKNRRRDGANQRNQ